MIRSSWTLLFTYAFSLCTPRIASAENAATETAVRQHLRKGRYLLAEPLVLEQLQQNDDDVQALSELAWIYYSLGKKAECLLTCDKAIKINPQSAPISYIYSLLHYEDWKLAMAINYIDKALHVDPSNATYVRHKALLLVQSHQPDEARELIAGHDRNSSPSLRLIDALIVEEKGDRAKAKSMLASEWKGKEASVLVKYNFVRMVAWGREVVADEVETAMAMVEELAAHLGASKVDFIPQCVFHFVTASVYASKDNFESAKLYQRVAIVRYESGCGIPLEEFQSALSNFENNKRVIRE